MLKIFERKNTPKLNKIKSSPSDTCKKPWSITKVENGLRAVNGNPTTVKFWPTKDIPVKYYEFDRIFGKGAWSSDGVMRVMDMFDDLKRITPLTEYFIFGIHHYINRDDGILKMNRDTKKESFYSTESLRNKDLSSYFSLNYEDGPEIEESEIEIHGKDTASEEIYSESTELETT